MSTGEPVVHDPEVRVGAPVITGAPTIGPGVVIPSGSDVGRREFDALGDRVDDLAVAVDEVAARPREYPHTQNAPSAVWLLQHGLGFCPQFSAYDTEGRPIMHGGITHPVPGEVSEVMFGAPFSGRGIAS